MQLVIVNIFESVISVRRATVIARPGCQKP